MEVWLFYGPGPQGLLPCGLWPLNNLSSKTVKIPVLKGLKGSLRRFTPKQKVVGYFYKIALKLMDITYINFQNDIPYKTISDEIYYQLVLPELILADPKNSF